MFKRTFLTATLIAICIGGFYTWQLLKPAVKNADNRMFYIFPEDNPVQVREKLSQLFNISESNYNLACRVLRFYDPKPGRYKLPDGTSILDLVRKLRAGNQEPVKMVINKERTKELFAGKFGAGKRFDTHFDSLQMIRFLNDREAMKKYDLDTGNLMAAVIPDTYEILWDHSPEKVFDMLYFYYKKFWNQERMHKADSLGLTPFKATVLASIVEEETNLKEDKYKIASTYLNRLRLGMKLQADPTVRYATRNFSIKRVTYDLLTINSDYNTYLHTGLPPGPICTPSKSTIDAVLNAPETDYLFFVASSKFDGSSIFTSNYSDHLKYARLYQKELTRRMDSVRKAKANP